jgi:hypothetical protein
VQPGPGEGEEPCEADRWMHGGGLQVTSGSVGVQHEELLAKGEEYRRLPLSVCLWNVVRLMRHGAALCWQCRCRSPLRIPLLLRHRSHRLHDGWAPRGEEEVGVVESLLVTRVHRGSEARAGSSCVLRRYRETYG